MTKEQIFAKAISLSRDKRVAFLDDVYQDRPEERVKMEAMIKLPPNFIVRSDSSHLQCE
ncbi:MAG: hypothetical protein ACE361_02700 [Aureliella sp.]